MRGDFLLMGLPRPARAVRICLIAGVLGGVVLSGCTAVGPSAVRSGRLAYNEAIAETNNQQMLMAIVKTRYEESANLLAVASVTANVSVTTTTGIQLGFGDSGNYAGNLVPFNAGAIYEENPTISYVPVAGARYARQILAPVPLSILAELTGTLSNPEYVYNALVFSINGVGNPAFDFSARGENKHFKRIVTILTRLRQAHRVHWIKDAEHKDSLSIVLDPLMDTDGPAVDELIRLLGLSLPIERQGPLVLPVFLALDGRQSGGLGIITRSVGQLVEILAAAVEVPDKDRQNGVARTYPPLGMPGSGLRIRHSATQPAHAAIAVQYRNYWFYIDETDQPTKRFFRLMSALWSDAIAESTSGLTNAPVLTVPVSR